MREFRVAWRGVDLYDSIEDDGMALTARACHHIACEIVSSIGSSIRDHVPEAWREDSWASLEFQNLGQRVRCVLALRDENDYSVSVGCVKGMFRSLIGRKAPREVMHQCIEDLVPPIALRDKSDRWWREVKASDDFFDRLFQAFYDKLGLPNLMRKTDYHVLARFMPPDEIDQEVTNVLDMILDVAKRAKVPPA
ncbi:MAG: hypothetical protein AB1714_15750 [Acidobacteriota bacterium]